MLYYYISCNFLGLRRSQNCKFEKFALFVCFFVEKELMQPTRLLPIPKLSKSVCLEKIYVYFVVQYMMTA